MKVDYGLLGVILAAEIAAMLVAAFAIGVILRSASNWKHARSRLRRDARPARELIEQAARR